ncbi:hypothetical protein ACFQ2T_04880 [Methylophilus flavus]|uniref:Uncharacterized protein n=1 Tax=Methylophilus flavus TaxID=640084 RepID=A0ABW3PA76_9PROT
MQNRTNLGMSIGQMLSSANGGNNSFMQGQQAGADIAYRKAAADKMNAEAESERAAQLARSDDGLAKTLLAGIGADSEDGRRDFNASLSGTYQPPTQPLAFIDGGKELPAPEYVAKFPELQNRYSTLKQMLALGDKDITHLPKTIQGDQRNAITANLGNATPQEAAKIGLRASALEGNVNPLEMQKAAILYGLTNGENSVDAQNALLLSQGKTRFDNTGDVGVIDLLTGNQDLNVIGTTRADENTGKANQANTAADLNTAKVDQTVASTNLNNANTGLVQAKTANEKLKPTTSKGSKGNATLPTPALKMQQEELEAIGTVAGTNSDLSAIKAQIENGTLKLGTFTNFLSGAKNYLGQSDESSQAYSTLQAMLEKARNASLQLNKGVQTDGDAQRAWNELITNLNDPEVVKKRLGEIVGYNERAVKLRKAKVNNLRSNYGAGPMDFSEFDSPNTSVKSKTPANTNPASSGQDQAAISWAKSNPNDPRAKQILQLNGQ